MTPDTLAKWSRIARQKSTLADHPSQATNSNGEFLFLDGKPLDWAGTLDCRDICRQRLQSGDRLPSDDRRLSRISSQANMEQVAECAKQLGTG